MQLIPLLDQSILTEIEINEIDFGVIQNADKHEYPSIHTVKVRSSI